MAEQTELEPANPSLTAEDMELESADPKAADSDAAANGEPNAKRPRDGVETDGDGESDDASKKQKVEKSVEEERLEKKTTEEPVRVSVGPKTFESSVEMFDYFFKFLHLWPANLNVNKYENLVLLDLLKKGHADPERKIGGGVRSFQVQYHPKFKSRCFFVIREDDSTEDFSFRKCVNQILPLPEEMKAKFENKSFGGNRGRGGRGGWRGKSRN